MKLLLHIGTEKTGSSFLQTNCARNRAALALRGIYFPEGGKREDDMLRGRISPGNGKTLFEALRAGELASARLYLAQAYQVATRKACTRVLISNENLVELAGYQGALSMLRDMASEIGFHGIEALLILRDPVEQALSLYKHRAKSGQLLPPDQWINGPYHTLRAVGEFLQGEETATWTVVLRKYQSAPRKMLQLFFVDWLQLEDDLDFSEVVVNPSLSLSELLFLQQQREINPALVPDYYEALLQLDKASKAGDDRLEGQYRRIFARGVLPYQTTIQQLNQLLPKTEQLSLAQAAPDEGEVELDLGNLSVTLSEIQLSTILRTTYRCSSWQGRIKIYWRSLKQRISKIYAGILRTNF